MARRRTSQVLFDLLGAFVVAVAIVAVTYNPSFWNLSTELFVAYREGGLEGLTAFVLQPHIVALLAVLVVFWFVYLRVTYKSLGTLGLILVAVVLAAGVYTLQYYQLVSQLTTWIWIAEILLAAVLAFGLQFSKVRYLVTGTRRTDDEDTDQ